MDIPRWLFRPQASIVSSSLDEKILSYLQKLKKSGVTFLSLFAIIGTGHRRLATNVTTVRSKTQP
jgi:hypothetical protein